MGEIDEKEKDGKTCAVVLQLVELSSHNCDNDIKTLDATRFIKHSAPARKRGRWYPALNCECEAFSGLFHHYRDNHCNDHPSQDRTSLKQRNGPDSLVVFHQNGLHSPPIAQK